MPDIQLRLAQHSDVATILQIQAACYATSLLENAQSFSAKIDASPSTCWLALHRQRIIAYVMSLPVSLANFPQLNAQQHHPDPHAHCLYVHDVAVHPDYQGLGASRMLVEHVKQLASTLQLSSIMLIAVQNAHSYWQQQGFVVQHNIPDSLQAKLATFGHNATLMQYAVPASLP